MLKATVIVAALVLPGTAFSQCATANTGAGCGTKFGAEGMAKRIAAGVTASAAYGPGDMLPPGRYFMLLGSEYYGLPPVNGFWRYYRVEDRVLRVRPDTLEVIEDATHETNRAF